MQGMRNGMTPKPSNWWFPFRGPIPGFIPFLIPYSSHQQESSATSFLCHLLLPKSGPAGSFPHSLLIAPASLVTSGKTNARQMYSLGNQKEPTSKWGVPVYCIYIYMYIYTYCLIHAPCPVQRLKSKTSESWRLPQAFRGWQHVRASGEFWRWPSGPSSWEAAEMRSCEFQGALWTPFRWGLMSWGFLIKMVVVD